MVTDIARLVVDEGHSLAAAMRRAARAHALGPNQARPRLEALWAAIREYRELFRPEQAQRLAAQRRLAQQAMETLAEFRPRLIGGLIHGDGPLDRIQLLVFADSPEPVMWHLNDRHIPWRESETLLHYSGNRRLARPTLRFVAGETTVELIVMARNGHSDPPRDAISGGPLEMLSLDQLTALIDVTGP